MTDEERKLALYCLKASSDYHSEVCEECIKYPNCDHTIQDDVTETIIKALEQEPCEDAVNRQAVLNTLDNMDKALNEDRTVENYKELLKECYEVLPSVTPQPTRWIPVSERLPELGRRVLCQCQANIYDVLKLTVYGWYHEQNHLYMESFVIAWMPLPEPYKESD